jgi:hypothetical protein
MIVPALEAKMQDVDFIGMCSSEVLCASGVKKYFLRVF